jgi:hypothetical protein
MVKIWNSQMCHLVNIKLLSKTIYTTERSPKRYQLCCLARFITFVFVLLVFIVLHCPFKGFSPVSWKTT